MKSNQMSDDVPRCLLRPDIVHGQPQSSPPGHLWQVGVTGTSGTNTRTRRSWIPRLHAVRSVLGAIATLLFLMAAIRIGR